MKNKNLYIIIDTSGSMIEGGKHFIARNFFIQLQQYIKYYTPNVNLKILSVNDETTEYSVSFEDEYPEELLNCKGKFNAEKTVEFLNTKFDKNQDKVLLITDDLSYDNERTVKIWSADLKYDTVRIIKLDMTESEKNTTENRRNCYCVEDLFKILNNWI